MSRCHWSKTLAGESVSEIRLWSNLDRAGGKVTPDESLCSSAKNAHDTPPAPRRPRSGAAMMLRHCQVITDAIYDFDANSVNESIVFGQLLSGRWIASATPVSTVSE